MVDDRDLGMARRQVVRDGCQVAGQPRRMGGGQDDAPAEREVPRDRERDPDQDDPDGQDEAVHGATISSSMTRSVDPPSRWAKWRAAKAATFSPS